MPTESRQSFVVRKVKHELKSHAKETRQEAITELISLMELQLENVKSQATHLADLQRRGVLKS